MVENLVYVLLYWFQYPVCELQWMGSLQSSSGRSIRQRTLSKSLTPSFNSAFTSPSSAQSTPVSVIVSENEHLRLFLFVCFVACFGFFISLQMKFETGYVGVRAWLVGWLVDRLVDPYISQLVDWYV